MTLPPRALQALADIKKSLLSPPPVTELNVVAEEMAEPAAIPDSAKRQAKPTQTMRHARVRAQAFQRFCRRGRNW